MKGIVAGDRKKTQSVVGKKIKRKKMGVSERVGEQGE